MTRGPDFDELVGTDLSAEERARLRGVHELLIAAGPPAELPPSLAQPAALAQEKVRFLPRRRRGALLLIAAALAAASFGAGYLVRDDGSEFDATRVLVMRGTGTQAAARGTIRVGEADEAGNSPMLVTVRGLRKLSPEGYYELLLSRNGKIVGPCGSFIVRGEQARFYLNAPYKLGPRDDWVVTMHPDGHVDDPPVVMRT